MIGFAKLTIAASGLLLSTSALAQSAVDTNSSRSTMSSHQNSSIANTPAQSVPPDRDTPQSLKIYSQMLGFGACAARVASKSIQSAMAEMPDSASERRMISDIQAKQEACRVGLMVNTLALIRGVLAEGAYRVLASGGISYGGLRDVDPGYGKFIKAEGDHNKDRVVNDQIFASAANCIVAQQPGLVDRLLTTTHGSNEEANVMDAVFVAAPSCAGPARQRNLSRSFLRAFLAESAYRYMFFRRPAQANAGGAAVAAPPSSNPSSGR